MPGRRRPAGGAQLVEVKLQGRGQRAGPVPFARVDDHARRLVDRRQRFVFVEDVERNVLGLRAFARQFGQYDRDPLAGLQPVRRLDAPSVHGHARGVDHLAQQHAAVGGKLLRQKPIQDGRPRGPRAR